MKVKIKLEPSFVQWKLVFTKLIHPALSTGSYNFKWSLRWRCFNPDWWCQSTKALSRPEIGLLDPVSNFVSRVDVIDVRIIKLYKCQKSFPYTPNALQLWARFSRCENMTFLWRTWAFFTFKKTFFGPLVKLSTFRPTFFELFFRFCSQSSVNYPL